MTILPNAIFRFYVIPIKLSIAFFRELEQKISQFIWKHNRPWIAKAVLKRMELEESTFLTSDYTTKLQSSRQYGSGTNIWNKIESPEINPCTCGHLIFDKGGKNIQWSKDSIFNKWCWENWSTTGKRMKLEHFLHHTQKETQNGLNI